MKTIKIYLFNHSVQLCKLYSIEWNMKTWWFDKILKVVIALKLLLQGVLISP